MFTYVQGIYWLNNKFWWCSLNRILRCKWRLYTVRMKDEHKRSNNKCTCSTVTVWLLKCKSLLHTLKPTFPLYNVFKQFVIIHAYAIYVFIYLHPSWRNQFLFILSDYFQYWSIGYRLVVLKRCVGICTSNVQRDRTIHCFPFSMHGDARSIKTREIYQRRW